MSNQRLRDQAYQYIRQELTEGRLQVGQRLSVGSLAKDIGISRTPVAEALLRLTMENIVEQVPRVGTMVRRPGLEEMADLYELRELLEAHTAARAAELIEEDDVKLLEQLVQEMRRMCTTLRDSDRTTFSTEEAARFLAIDLSFHMIIARAANNIAISRTIDRLRLFANVMAQRGYDENDLTSLSNIYRFHRQIQKAISRGDSEAAGHWMRRHIRSGRDGTLAFMARNSQQNYSSRNMANSGFESLAGNLQRILGSQADKDSMRAQSA